MYLIGQPPTKLRFAKLPTKGAILGRYLSLLENTSASEAAAMAREELKAVWLHHFAARLVEGKKLGIEEKGEEKKKIIKQDRFIDEKIMKMWKSWSKLETESRRSGRRPVYFKKSQEEFEKELRMPFNISKKRAKAVIEKSGIKDCREEIQHLRNQLSEDQVGCPGAMDNKQKKRDTKLAKLLSSEENAEKEAAEKAELLHRKTAEMERAGEDAEDNNDNDFVVKEKVVKKKVDVRPRSFESYFPVSFGSGDEGGGCCINKN